jgi:hypothetical protein
MTMQRAFCPILLFAAAFLFSAALANDRPIVGIMTQVFVGATHARVPLAICPPSSFAQD